MSAQKTTSCRSRNNLWGVLLSLGYYDDGLALNEDERPRLICDLAGKMDRPSFRD